MGIVTLLIGTVALVIAVLAYIRTGAIQDLRAQVGRSDSVIAALRTKTADMLDRLGNVVRSSFESTTPLPPAPLEGQRDEPKGATGSQQRENEILHTEVETQDRVSEVQQGGDRAQQIEAEIRPGSAESQEIDTKGQQGPTKAPRKATRTPHRGTRTRQKRAKTQRDSR